MKALIQIKEASNSFIQSDGEKGNGAKNSYISRDQQFINDVENAIEENMDNENFQAEDLAKAVYYSVSQLNRKLKRLEAPSAKQYIRKRRLEKARWLLMQNAKSVSEIAHEVGFTMPAYFSKCYKDHFGFSPTETARLHRHVWTDRPLYLTLPV
jgi:AraC-like DNA-binding protein